MVISLSRRFFTLKKDNIMYIDGILFIEDCNLTHIHLYKEGSFWKAYERSAFLFVKHIKAYRTKKKFYKNMQQDVISIGFPDVALSRLIDTQKVILRVDKSLTIALDNTTLDVAEFEQWKESCPLTVRADKKNNRAKVEAENRMNAEELKRAILSFPIYDSTPMQCMAFISELQLKTKN